MPSTHAYIHLQLSQASQLSGYRAKSKGFPDFICTFYIVLYMLTFIVHHNLSFPMLFRKFTSYVWNTASENKRSHSTVQQQGSNAPPGSTRCSFRRPHRSTAEAFQCTSYIAHVAGCVAYSPLSDDSRLMTWIKKKKKFLFPSLALLSFNKCEMNRTPKDPTQTNTGSGLLVVQPSTTSTIEYICLNANLFAEW